MSRRRNVRLAGCALLIGAAAAGVLAARQSSARATPDMTGGGIPLDRPARPVLGAAGNARMLPPEWEPAILTALASWAPPAPRSPLARAAAYAWALPLTCVGLLAGLLTGVRPQVREGAVLYAHARGPAGMILRRRGFAAGAIGHVVIAVGDPSPTLLVHELVHVRHAERLGVFSAPLYLALLAIYGYARHPMERAARVAARLSATVASP